jgi:hypothetical protein
MSADYLTPADARTMVAQLPVAECRQVLAAVVSRVALVRGDDLADIIWRVRADALSASVRAAEAAWRASVVAAGDHFIAGRMLEWADTVVAQSAVYGRLRRAHRRLDRHMREGGCGQPDTAEARHD